MTFNFFTDFFFSTDLFFSHTFCKLFNKQNNLWSLHCICVARSGTVNTKQYMKLKFYKFKIKIIKLINLKKLTLQEPDKELIWCHLWKRSWSSDFKLVQSAGEKKRYDNARPLMLTVIAALWLYLHLVAILCQNNWFSFIISLYIQM